MPPAGFEPAIPAGDRPQTLALDRLASGIGYYYYYYYYYYYSPHLHRVFRIYLKRITFLGYTLLQLFDSGTSSSDITPYGCEGGMSGV